MTDFTITNVGSATGAAGSDRLIYTSSGQTGATVLTGITGTFATGYTGTINGAGTNDATFSAIEHFTFTDLSGFNDTITGGDGNDSFTGGNGADSLTGGLGNDTIYGGSGADYVYGGAGNDLLSAGDDNDVVNSGTGIDQVDGGAGFDVWTADMSAQTGAITIAVGVNSTFLTTGSVMNIEALSLSTGSGNDSITGGASADVITANAGNDTIYGGAGIDALSGGAGNDSMFGGTENDTLNSGSGIDVVDGGTGIDRWQADLSAAVDAISIDISITSTFLGTGSVTGVEQLNLTTGSGNDTILSYSSNDTINAGAGNDLISSGSGVDSVNGGTGVDRWTADLTAAAAAVVIDLNLASSTFLSSGRVVGIEAVTLTTGAHADNITLHSTSAQDDTLVTAAGDDRVKLWVGGADIINGGTGTDTLEMTNTLAGTAISSSNMTATSGMYSVGAGGTVTFADIEKFNITDAVDGNDFIELGALADTVSAGGGDDVINASTGADVVNGGAGNDLWSANLTATTLATTIDLNGTSSYLGTGSVTGVEAMNLQMGIGDDTITGHATSAMADTLHAGDGHDRIKFWFGGADVINGGAGTDTLELINTVAGTAIASSNMTATSGVYSVGAAGSVTFNAMQRYAITDSVGGNDFIVVGAQADTVLAGLGDDTIDGTTGADNIDGGAGNDMWLADLSATTTDTTIDLNAASTFLDTGIVTGVEGMNITLGSGNDVVVTHASSGRSDTISAGAGNDLFQISLGGVDSVNGGDGNDLLEVIINTAGGISIVTAAATVGNGSSGTITGANGNIIAFDQVERFRMIDMYGNDDSIRGGEGLDTLLGGGGNDTLRGYGGDDSIDGGSGTDIWDSNHSLATAALVLNVNNSVNTFGVSGLARDIEGLRVTATTLADTITLHQTAITNDRVTSSDGADSITMWAGGVDTISGGTSSDKLTLTWTGAATNKTTTGFVDSGSGFGGVYTGANGNSITFDDIETFFVTDLAGGDDLIRSGDGNDKLIGGAGNDTLSSGKGLDSVDGGIGLDVWQADTSAKTLAVQIDINKSSTYHYTANVKNVEALDVTLGSGADFISGHMTSGMNDHVRSGSGGDRITLWLGGDDTVNGGAGTDTLLVKGTASDGGVELAITSGSIATGYSGSYVADDGDTIVFSAVENFAFTDVAGGADTIKAGAGNDTISGGAGNDSISGSTGTDSINGGTGNDTIYGGKGSDFLTGGTGADVFWFFNSTYHGSDKIYDFTDGSDKIRIDDGSMSLVTIRTVNTTDTEIKLKNGTVILLDEFASANLSAADFMFV